MEDLNPKQQVILEQAWDANVPALILSRSLTEDEFYGLRSNYRDIVIGDFATAAYHSLSVYNQVLSLKPDAIKFLHGPIHYPFGLIRLLCIELHVYTYGRLLIKDKEYVFTGPPDNWGSFLWKTQVDEIELAKLIKVSSRVLISQS